MTTQVSVDSAVNAAIRMMQNQLNNTMSMLETQAGNIAEAMNAEADAYNSVCDTAEELDNQVIALKDEVSVLQVELKQSGIASKNEISQLNAKLSRANLSVADYAKLEKELADLKALNPSRLQKKNKELRATNDERLKANQALKKNFNSTSELLAERTIKLSKLTNLISEMNVELEDLRARINLYDGNVCKREFKGQNGLSAYIYDFCWGLSTRPSDGSVTTVGDFDWHLEVRTNFGINVTISVTDWLVPFYPSCSDLADSWPDDIHNALAEIILERSQSTHSHLVDRYDWAKSVELDSVPGIKPRQLKLLNDSNFLSLYAACHVPPAKLCLMVKGIGEEACKEIHRHCMAYVKEWEAANWTREQRGLK